MEKVSTALFLEETGMTSRQEGHISRMAYRLKTSSTALRNQKWGDKVRVYNCQGEEISSDGCGLPLDALCLSMDEEHDSWNFCMHPSQQWNARFDTVTE